MSRRSDRERVKQEVYAALRPYIGSIEISLQRRLGDYIVKSIDAASFVSDVSKRLGIGLSPTLFWQCPTVERLVAYLSHGGGGECQPGTVIATRNQEIAVVGFACRFPGAPDADAYWTLLDDGANAVSDCPPTRLLRLNELMESSKFDAVGGFLPDVELFDNKLFNISPREAVCMDPQQRILAEVAWEALEHAGLPPSKLLDKSGGVFIGSMWSDYVRYFTTDSLDVHSATGLDSSILAARLSYLLGIRGPSLTVNTACSSSLVAIHLARQSLISGESDFALAGGVNLILAPHSTIALSRFGGLSPTNSCNTFDAAADGYVRAEGCGVVVLKRLEDAIASGDNIRGVVIGTATNNNGHSVSLTAPSQNAQEQLLLAACRTAQIDPLEISYVEAHGTGTALGDPIEVNALVSALCSGRDPRNPLRVGSVKTNIGHCEAAAGIAGVIKVLLAMRHQTLPAHLNFSKPNPAIPLQEAPIVVNHERIEWTSPGSELVAGVSSFGFGGSNCHLIMKSWNAHSTRDVATPSTTMAEAASDRSPASVRTALVFPGQGSQWPQMGRILFGIGPAFREMLTRCDEFVQSREGWSIAQFLLRNDGLIDDTKYLWPSLIAIQMGLAASWRALGLQPNAVIGHSIGEISAAQCAGALSVEEALELSVLQGKWAAQHKGGMALVQLDWEEAGALLHELRMKRVHRAVQQDSTSTIVSGSRSDLTRLEAVCKRRSISFASVRVKSAMHRPLSEAAKSALLDCLPTTGSNRLSITFYASSLGGPAAAENLSREYWVRNLMSPVRWAQTVAAAIADGIDAFIELAPHPIMARSLCNIASAQQKDCLVLPSAERGRNAIKVMGCSAATLADRGVDLDLNALPLDADQCRVAGVIKRRQQEEIPHVVPISAHTEEALRDRCGALASHLEKQTPRLRDIAYTCAVRRDHLKHRVAIVASSVPQLAADLRAVSEGRYLKSTFSGNRAVADRRILFVFTEDMIENVSQLHDDPVYSREYRKFRTTIMRLGVADTEAADALCRQAAVAAKLGSLGIEPSAVCGTGLGRITAAYVGGHLSLEQAVALWCDRDISRLATSDVADKDSAPAIAETRDLETVSYLSCATGKQIAQFDGDHSLVDTSEHARDIEQQGLVGLCRESQRVIWFGNERGRPLALLEPHEIEHDGPPDHSSKILLAASYLSVIAALYADGASLPWSSISRPGSLVELPRFPWQRRKYWPEQMLTGGLESAGCDHGSPNRAPPAFVVGWNARISAPSSNLVASAVARLVFCEARHRDQLRRLVSFANAVWVIPGRLYRRVDDSTFEVNPRRANDFSRLLHEVGRVADIVYLWGLAVGDTVREFPDAEEMLVNAPLHLLQGLLSDQSSAPCDVWLVTSGSQAVCGGNVSGAAQAVLWGWGRTIALEHPELFCRLLDVDPLAPDGRLSDDAVWSIDESLARRTEEQELAWRGRVCFSQKLRQINRGPELPSARAQTIQCAVISGGLGALGLKIAEKRVRSGTSQLVLIGRNSPSPEAQAAIARLESFGATILTIAADVADRRQLSAALAQAVERFGPPDAIYHAAGTLEAASLSSMTAAGYQQALAPKFRGGWNLHVLTKDMPIRTFVLISSASSVLGLPRYASYTAGNAFLDALACERRRLGLPATSISLGPLADVGIATKGNAPASFPGLPPIPVDEAVVAIDWLDRIAAPHQVIMNYDAEAWDRMGLPPKVEGARAVEIPASLRPRIAQMPEAERGEFVLQHVIDVVGKLLKQDASEIPADAPFSSLGLNSLLSLEFRNRLQKLFNVPLPSTLVWSFPTVGQLAAALNQRLGTEDDPRTVAGATAMLATVDGRALIQPCDLTSATSDIDGLSAAELEALLVAEIEAVNRQYAKVKVTLGRHSNE